MTIYAIKDEVIGFTGAVMTLHNDDEAKRMMSSTVNANDNQIAMYPKDFSIWRVGELDRISGAIEPEATPQYVCRASDFTKEVKDEIPNAVQ